MIGKQGVAAVGPAMVFKGKKLENVHTKSCDTAIGGENGAEAQRR